MLTRSLSALRCAALPRRLTTQVDVKKAVPQEDIQQAEDKTVKTRKIFVGGLRYATRALTQACTCTRTHATRTQNHAQTNTHALSPRSVDVSEASLKEYFSKFGTVLDALIMVDRDTGRSRGFAFVSFGTVWVWERGNACVHVSVCLCVVVCS